MKPFHFILRKQKWRKYFTNTACVNVGNDESPIFLNNVVLEFNFHSINNSMCFLLKKK